MNRSGGEEEGGKKKEEESNSYGSNSGKNVYKYNGMDVCATRQSGVFGVTRNSVDRPIE